MRNLDIEDKKVTYTYRCYPQTHANLNQIAQQVGTIRSRLIRDAIEIYISQIKK